MRMHNIARGSVIHVNHNGLTKSAKVTNVGEVSCGWAMLTVDLGGEIGYIAAKDRELAVHA